MYPRQRLFRAVNWALGLTLFALAVVAIGFLICPMSAATFSALETIKLNQDRPPETAPQAELDGWSTRSGEIGRAAYSASLRTSLQAAVVIGIPIALLLVVIGILLYRVRRMLDRGV